jgi:hypothetical protein
MPLTVPSQIVALIDGYFAETRATSVSVTHGSVAVLTAIVRLIDEIPTELLAISGDDYRDLVFGVEAIRNTVVFWQHKGVGEVGLSNIRGKNVLQLIRDALAKCPNQVPSPATVDLPRFRGEVRSWDQDI